MRTSPQDGAAPRKGERVESHALILEVIDYQEGDRIVSLLTQKFGKISARALKAARSVKRFGAALEVGNHVLARMTAPGDREGALWRLEETEIRANFSGTRQSYARLETAAFVLNLVRQTMPDDENDLVVFQSLGRFLRGLEKLENANERAPWVRTMFWCWLMNHWGHGNVVADQEILKSSQILAKVTEIAEPDFEAAMLAMGSENLPTLHFDHEVALYRTWLQRTGLIWKGFELWCRSKQGV